MNSINNNETKNNKPKIIVKIKSIAEKYKAKSAL